MSHENGDDPEDEPKTYRDYQIAKNPRASKPEENDDPMDPAANFDDGGDDDWQADVAKGLREDLPDDMVKDADADDRTPMETVLNALQAAWCRDRDPGRLRALRMVLHRPDGLARQAEGAHASTSDRERRRE